MVIAGEQDDGIIASWCLAFLGLAAADLGDVRGASDALRASLALGTEDQMRHNFDQLLAAASVLASARGRPDVSARIWGAVQAEQVATGVQFGFPECVVFERNEARLRAALGDDSYGRALAEGRGLGRDAVLAEVEAILAEESNLAAPMK